MTDKRISSNHTEDNRHAQEFNSASEQHIGRGWHGDSEGHAAAGRKGGQTVAQNRDHMASIGRKGGQAVSRDRHHMAEIGRRGGQARGKTNKTQSSEANDTQRA